jgi:flagellar hook-associated protein 1 FlgK
MSLGLVMNSAVSGLQTAQAGLNATSANLANVNTPGYARKVVQQEVQVLDGRVAGVDVATVRRVTDDYLAGSVRTSAADKGRLDTTVAFLDQVQALLGKPESNAGFTGKLTSVFGALSDLSSEPTSSTRQQAAVQRLQALGVELAREAGQIQVLRANADREIETQLSAANSAAARIHELNREIERTKIGGGDSGGLDDQRAAALNGLATVLDFTINVQPGGSWWINLPGGQPLVDSAAWELQHASAGSVGADTVFGPVTVHRVDPQTGQAAAAGTPVDSTIGSGTLRGLMDLRDDTLPDLARQLGEFAGQVVDALNAVHNLGTAGVPPASLTGRNTGLLGTDAHGFSGQASISTVDAGGNIVTTLVLDFDGGGMATIDDVVAAVDGQFGPGSATFVDGVLTVSPGGGNGVVVQQGLPAAQRGGMGFSHFFGLNDLMQTGVPSNGRTGLVPASAHGYTAGTMTLSLEGPGDQARQVTINFAALAGGTVQDVVNALNAGFGGATTFALNPNGELTRTEASNFRGWDLHLSVDDSARGGTGMSFSTLFALGQTAVVDRATTLSVRQDVVDDPSLIATARADLGQIVSGDARGAEALAAVAGTKISFGAAGGLPRQTATLGEYGAQVIGRASDQTAAARSAQTDRNILHGEVQSRLAAVEGVNLDEELANMIALQSAYNASARLITAVKEMLDELLRI